MRESVPRNPFIKGVWPSLLFEIVNEFIQHPSFARDTSEANNQKTNGINLETLGSEVAHWLQNAETFGKTLQNLLLA